MTEIWATREVNPHFEIAVISNVSTTVKFYKYVMHFLGGSTSSGLQHDLAMTLLSDRHL